MPQQLASILITPEDYELATAMSLPVPLIVVSGTLEEVEFKDGQGQLLSLDQVALHAIGCLSRSKGGKKRLAKLATLWKDKRKDEAPAELPLETSEPSESRKLVLEWLVTQLAKTQQQGAQRATRLMRELSLMRQQHEEIQTNFQNLEQFVYRHGPHHRTLEVNLSPISGQLPITLKGGSQLVQRLPGSSVGLSDFAIHVNNDTPPTNGMLNVSLFSPDTNETLAIWEVPAARLSLGWLRFSLERTLGPDPISLTLNVNYQGNSTVRLSSAVQHPEPRFHPELDDLTVETLPALQLWRWIPGVHAPIPVHAMLQVGGRNRLRRVEPEMMATAIDFATLNSSLPMFESGDALLVHVMPKQTNCGFLSGLALEGTRQIFATLATRHPGGPTIEYQMALLPQDQRPHKSGRLPVFDPALTSGWISLPPEEEGQSHVFLEQPLDKPHDIYLMTRLPRGHTSNAYGWSTFSNICLQF